jgi:hypothetical protein
LKKKVLCFQEAMHVSACALEEDQLRMLSISTTQEKTHQVMEVSTSFQSTIFRVHLFGQARPANCLTCGDFVYIEDTEGKRSLQPHFPSVSQMYAPPATSNKVPAQLHFGAMDASFEQADAIWVVESRDKYAGGLISWEAKFVLRHLKTGMFLAAEDQSEDTARLTLTPARDSDDGSNVIRFMPASASALRKSGDMEFVHNASASFVQCDDFFVTKCETSGIGTLSARVKSATPIVLRIVAPSGHTHPVLFGLQAAGPLEHYARHLTHGVEKFDGEASQICDILDQLCRFLIQEGSKKDFTQFATKPSHMLKVAIKNQSLLREGSILDLVVSILCSSLAVLPVTTADDDTDESWKLVEKCMHVLRLLVIRNEANQLSAAAAFGHLVQFIDQRIGRATAGVVSELLGNREVQESHIGANEIRVLLKMMERKPLNATVVQVLEQLCECNDEIIESNQQLLVDWLVVDKQVSRPSSINTLVSVVPQDDNTLRFKFPSMEQGIKVEQCNADEMEFLTTQLNLYAAICAGRFYIAILPLRQMFPYTHLHHLIDDMPNLQRQLRSCSEGRVSSLGTDISVRFTAAVVRLITTIYVNCEPQRLPIQAGWSCTWSEIVDPSTVRLPGPNSEAKALQFKPLEQLIKGALDSHSTNMDTLSVFELLDKFLTFNFYNHTGDGPQFLHCLLTTAMAR